MENKPLNVVYIGQQTFPKGAATTKRRRYMVDYMNNHNISNHVLVTFYPGDFFKNDKSGFYGKTEYLDIKYLLVKGKICQYYSVGKTHLRKWYQPEAQNVLIFPTVLNFFDYPFFRYALKLGYKVVFDQVETSYLKSGNLRLKNRIYYSLNEYFSKKAYRKSSSFVISSALLEQNRQQYPDMQLQVLPNSTPILRNRSMQRLNDTLQVLYSGTYGEKEGVSYLIEGVLAAISKGCKCKLVLLGKASEQLSIQYAGKDGVEFKGFVSDEELVSLLKESDILAVVRTNTLFANYGFPFKLSEYLSTGNIVMSTKVGDVCEYMADKKDAYLIEPENSDAICETIMHIENNEEEAIKIAANGLKTMKAKFGIETVGHTFDQFLRKI